jgi:hypothetical protein
VHSELQKWVLDWFGSIPGHELAMVMTALYHLWITRNNARDEPMIQSPELTAGRILTLTEEWRNLKTAKPRQQSSGEGRWFPLENGWHKVNADGAYEATTGTGGGGVIVRNHHGDPVAGVSYFFTHVSDPERAELLACRQAVQWPETRESGG